MERIEKSDRIVVVGTPLYRRKYENKDSTTGYVVAAEVDLINNRLLGTESQKQNVLPLLLDGDKADSLPPLLHGRVYADFRDDTHVFCNRVRSNAKGLSTPRKSSCRGRPAQVAARARPEVKPNDGMIFDHRAPEAHDLVAELLAGRVDPGVYS